jgi:hypothetical protein
VTTFQPLHLYIGRCTGTTKDPLKETVFEISMWRFICFFVEWLRFLGNGCLGRNFSKRNNSMWLQNGLFHLTFTCGG